MPRYKLTIAYDGTDFCGWQKQEPPAGSEIGATRVLAPRGGSAPDPAEPPRITLRTVQEVVERTVRAVVREPVQLIGASRTDAGVHARGQVAAFTCSGGETARAGGPDTVGDAPADPPLPGRTGWPLERGTDALIRAVNSRLPEDVLVLGAEAVAAGFNPIGHCESKGYSYRLHVSPHRALWDRNFVHHVWVPLDMEQMNAAAASFVGEHDFAAFAAAGHGRLSTVRTVYECRVVDEGGVAGSGPGWERRLRIDISGNGFLWNMVRIIAGTLVEVGKGRLSAERVAEAIASKDRRQAGPTLPPTGLCLDWIRYPASAGEP